MPLAFRAQGGRVPAAFGGLMGNDGRRAYGLGSIFKKAKRTAKRSCFLFRWTIINSCWCRFWKNQSLDLKNSSHN